MLTSSTGTRARASSVNRASIPSYRPQANTRCAIREYVAAVSCRNWTPAGVGTTSLVPGDPDPSTASRASPHGTGLMTIPGPPPKGVSSTLRCTSWAQFRRSCTANSIRPRSAALPSRETPSGLKYPGKIVMMSTFTASARNLALGTALPQVKEAGWRVDDEPPASQIHLDGNRRHERHEHLRAP